MPAIYDCHEMGGKAILSIGHSIYLMSACLFSPLRNILLHLLLWIYTCFSRSLLRGFGLVQLQCFFR